MRFFFVRPFTLVKCLLICNLLIIHFISRAQNGNTFAKQLVSKTTYRVDNNFNSTSYNRDNRVTDNYTQQVDSIAGTAEISSHFARVYSKALGNLETGIQKMDTTTASFIKKFENAFAESFLNACLDNKNGNLSTSSEWKCVFSNPGARPWQLALLGVNVHVNIDFWQAMINKFSQQEIMQHRKQLIACKSSIAMVYSEFFDSILEESSYLRFVNSFTKGMAKKLGEKIVFKWRRRSINLAVLFYTDHEKFERKKDFIKNKKNKIDQAILRKGNIAAPESTSQLSIAAD